MRHWERPIVNTARTSAFRVGQVSERGGRGGWWGRRMSRRILSTVYHALIMTRQTIALGLLRHSFM